MLITDYTLSWVDSRRAVLSWDGGSADCWWSIFLDGRSFGPFYASGIMSYEVSLSERENHTVAIIQHDADVNGQPTPESARLLRPTIRWLGVSNAVEYLIYEVEDTVEYLIHKVKGDGTTGVFSWQYPMNLPSVGVDTKRIRVHARGLWGLSEVPTVRAGFIAGHPARAASLGVEDSSAGMELTLAT